MRSSSFFAGAFLLAACHASTPTPPPPSTAAPAEPGPSAAPAPTDGEASPAAGTVPAGSGEAASAEPGQVGDACGGLSGASCEAGLFCQYALDAHCGAADQTGQCAEKPQVCTREFRPVCGCDDKTYPTACVAASKGVSVATEGKCPQQP